MPNYSDLYNLDTQGFTDHNPHIQSFLSAYGSLITQEQHSYIISLAAVFHVTFESLESFTARRIMGAKYKAKFKFFKDGILGSFELVF